MYERVAPTMVQLKAERASCAPVALARLPRPWEPSQWVEEARHAELRATLPAHQPRWLTAGRWDPDSRTLQVVIMPYPED